MNGRLHIGSWMGVILMAAMVLSACATTPASTPTPEPTATAAPALLSKPPELILAINKPHGRTSSSEHVVYTLPEMDKVLLASELAYYNDLTLDIYYPPDYRFEAKLPIAILSHGFAERGEFDKDMAQHIDWAKLIAASGMIAVSAQAGTAPETNSYHVLEFLAANADLLGIDLTRIGFWACSGQGTPVFKALGDKELPYRDGFRAAVFLYLDVRAATPGTWPQNLSLFVIRAGADTNVSGPAMVRLVSEARASGIRTEYYEYALAPHAFDVLVSTQEAKDLIQHALEFLKRNLLQ